MTPIRGIIHFNSGGTAGVNKVQFDKNNVSVLGSGKFVLFSSSRSNRDNNFTNNIFAINNSNPAIYLTAGTRNFLFINNTYMVDRIAIVLNGSAVTNPNVTNITFINDTIRVCDFDTVNCNDKNIAADFYLTGNASNIYLQNVNFNKTRLIVNSTEDSGADYNNATVQWFFYLNVTDTSGNAISGATVEVNDSKNSIIWKGTTNSRGSIDDLMNVTEFEVNGTTAQFYQSCVEAVNEASDAVDNITCYSPLNISVVKNGYDAFSLT